MAIHGTIDFTNTKYENRTFGAAPKFLSRESGTLKCVPIPHVDSLGNITENQDEIMIFKEDRFLLSKARYDRHFFDLNFHFENVPSANLRPMEWGLVWPRFPRADG